MSKRDYVSGESDSMDAILASDRFIEQLRTTGTFEPTSREDAELAFALLDWRDDVRAEPFTPPPVVDDLDLIRIKAQPRRIAQRSVAVAAVLLAMSSAAATALDGDPLRPVRFLVDLGVTVGEGIGNPDRDSSTDDVELKNKDLSGDPALIEDPAITVTTDDPFSLDSYDASNTTAPLLTPKDPAESPGQPGADSDGTVPEAQPTDEAPEVEAPPEGEDSSQDTTGDNDTTGDDTPGDDSGGTDGDTDADGGTDGDPVQPSDTPPTDTAPPSDQPPQTPTDGDGGQNSEDDPPTDPEQQNDDGPLPDEGDPPSEGDQPTDTDPGETPPGDSEPITDDDSNAGDDAAGESDGADSVEEAFRQFHAPEWWGDRMPPGYWNALLAWADAHSHGPHDPGNPAWRGGHR